MRYIIFQRYNKYIYFPKNHLIKIHRTDVNIKLVSESEVKDYKVETSLDGEEWKVFDGRPLTARFIKISCENGIKISEFTVLGQ